MNRRKFIQGTVGALAASVLSSKTSLLYGQEDTVKSIRIGVVGVGGRGREHVDNLISFHQGVIIAAVCDIKDDRVQSTIELVKKKKGYAPVGYSGGEYEYRKMLERDDLDGVLIATGPYWIGRIALDTMRSGKHVGFEVPGVLAIEECHELVRVKEQTGKRCMLLENCCYGNENMMIYNMIQQGVFGEPYFAEGSYLHDCRPLFFEPDGSLTWRGRLVRDEYGCNYNPHAVGSLSKWLGINDGDRMEYCTAMMSKPRETHEYAEVVFGKGSPQAKIDFKTGDFVTTLIYTAKGKQIRIDNGITGSRPYSRYYGTQCTKGSFDSRMGLYLRSNGTLSSFSDHGWEPWDEYLEKWQHPYWKTGEIEAAQQGGHGGIDWFVMYDFAKMIRDNKEPWIDVYDAATWSSLLHCSRLSIDSKSGPVEIPDFTKGRWKDPNWRSSARPTKII